MSQVCPSSIIMERTAAALARLAQAEEDEKWSRCSAAKEAKALEKDRLHVELALLTQKSPMKVASQCD